MRDLFAVANLLVVIGHCRLMELLILLKDAVGHTLTINRPMLHCVMTINSCCCWSFCYYFRMSLPTLMCYFMSYTVVV